MRNGHDEQAQRLYPLPIVIRQDNPEETGEHFHSHGLLFHDSFALVPAFVDREGQEVVLEMWQVRLIEGTDEYDVVRMETLFELECDAETIFEDMSGLSFVRFIQKYFAFGTNL